MSKRELGRVEVLARVRSKALRVVDASGLLRVSTGRPSGCGAVSGGRSCGAEASQRGAQARIAPKTRKFRQQVLRQVGKSTAERWAERFGPTLATEHLASEDGLKIHAENAAALDASGRVVEPGAKTAATPFAARAQKKHFGEMVQMDGSFHAWLEERGPGLLIDLVDDAHQHNVGTTGEQETIWAVVDALRA